MTILICALAAIVAAVPGYLISYKFNKSNYAATDRSGDFGAPRGGVFAIASGLFIGIVFIRLLGALHLVADAAIGSAMLTAMLVGLVAGIVGLFRGTKARSQKKS